MMKLSVKKEGNKTKLYLDGVEIKGVTDFAIMSSGDKPTELTLTMLVNYPEEQS